MKNNYEEKLRNLFLKFNTDNLKGISGKNFEAEIRNQIGKVDGNIEKYADIQVENQRDLSIKFHWGHNHDFGDFKIKGRMGDRHIKVMANFMKFFPVGPESFENKSVFDIGCWTGGTSLLLNALGAKVHAIEEVVKYSNMAKYLADSFGLNDSISIKPNSIYSCNNNDYFNKFDIVFFPGVIYHLSDPVLALRILYNSLKLNSIILVESAGINEEKPYCQFEGNYIYNKGTKQELNRGGWNWFLPSPSALERMIKEAGFSEINSIWDENTNRVFAFARKTAEVGICKAGLSVPDIK